jgi:hypothetical protein
LKIWRRVNYSVLAATIVLYIIAVVTMHKGFVRFPSHQVFLLTIAVVALFAVSNTLWRIARDKSVKALNKTEVELNGR